MPDSSIHEAGLTSPAPLDRLPPEVLGSLTASQKNAIASAARTPGWTEHRVNIRISLPLLPRRWYFTIVGGPERRAADRRRAGRIRNPLRTVGNVAFVFLFAVLFYGVAISTFLFSSAVLEY